MLIKGYNLNPPIKHLYLLLDFRPMKLNGPTMHEQIRQQPCPSWALTKTII